MLPRHTRPSWLAVVCAGLAVAACGNLSLDASSGFDAPEAPSSGGNGSDAGSVDGFGGSTPATGADAGAPGASTTVGSPLCGYSYSGAHRCQPDDSSQCTLASVDWGDAGAPPSPSPPIADDAGSDVDGSQTPSNDAGTATAEDAGDAGDAGATGACHVERDNGSAAQTCSAPGAGGDGAQCRTGADCAASFECVGTPGECRHYCCEGESSCAGTAKPSFCDIQSVASGDVDAGGASSAFRVPVCMPVAKCMLFATCATAGETCTIVDNEGTTSCVDPGSVPVGGSCETDHCQANLACLGNEGSRTCAQLCRIDTPSDCPSAKTCTSSAQLFQDSSYGLCL